VEYQRSREPGSGFRVPGSGFRDPGVAAVAALIRCSVDNREWESSARGRRRFCATRVGLAIMPRLEPGA
jgi:hypothetical protein